MGKFLASEHNVSRYIKKKLIMRDEQGKAVGIYPQAFELRDDEKSLSASWLEYFNGTTVDNIKSSIDELKSRPYNVHDESGVGVANVGTLISVCNDFRHNNVKVLHDGEDNKQQKIKSHSSIKNTSNDNELLSNLANKAFSSLHIIGDI